MHQIVGFKWANAFAKAVSRQLSTSQ